jgi:hypothetical protein
MERFIDGRALDGNIATRAERSNGEEFTTPSLEAERTTLAIGAMLGAWLTILLLAGSTS